MGPQEEEGEVKRRVELWEHGKRQRGSELGTKHLLQLILTEDERSSTAQGVTKGGQEEDFERQG